MSTKVTHEKLDGICYRFSDGDSWKDACDCAVVQKDDVEILVSLAGSFETLGLPGGHQQKKIAHKLRLLISELQKNR